jgi:DNA-binding NarL/FixJ family response regulator
MGFGVVRANRPNAITLQLAIGVEMIRLLIVEDQPAVRKGLKMRLSAEADLCVVGEAEDGMAVLELAKMISPDVVLLDVEMPHLDGIKTAKALHAMCPHVGIIMLSIHDDALTRARAQGAGAAAFVAKTLPTDILLTTIRQVAHSGGQAIVDFPDSS